jgi:O-antigen/teichoic acid export membrane protein
MLGPAGRGQLAAALVWAGVVTACSSFGLPQALTYFTARKGAEVTRITGTAIRLLIIQSAIALAASWLVTGLLWHGSVTDLRTPIRIYLFSVPGSMLISYLSAIAQGLRRFAVFNVLRISWSVASLAGLLTAWAAGATQVIPVLLAMLSGQTLAAACCLIYFCRNCGRPGRYVSARSRELLRYGLRTYWGNLSWMANARLDQLIMSVVLAPAALGEYAVAVSYATCLFPVSGAFAAALYPAVSGAETPGEASALIRRTVLANLVVTSVGAALMALLAWRLIPAVFGGSFSNSVHPAIVLLMGAVLLGSNYVMSDALRGLGRPELPSWAEGLALAVTVTGLILVLRQTGIVGAAWVSAASYAAAAVVLARGTRLTLWRQAAK